MQVDDIALDHLLPHGGAMRLLDGVLACDERRIVCVSARHRDPGNPLRQGGELSSLCGIEFAAQAMAAHGALMSGVARLPVAGRLARVRDCRIHRERIDDIAAPLRIEAERLAGSERALSYRFALTADEAPIVSGLALVVLAGEGEP
jgi:predicted hotdog family 3-hydroxylacyl-ACP dehydratase